MTPAEEYTSYFYTRFPGRIPLTAGLSTKGENVYPLVFEGENGSPIGIVSMAANSNYGSNHVQVYLLSVFYQRCGHGSKILEALCEEADKRNITLHVQAEPQWNDDSDWIPKDKLMSWYKRFGFQGYYAMSRPPVSAELND